MSPPIGPKVKGFEKTPQFKRHENSLDSRTDKELKTLYKEMRAGSYSNSRDVKIIKGTKKNKHKVWQARISQNYRIRFEFKKGVAKLLLVGPHKLFK